MKIDCGITLESSEVINKNIKYLKRLKEIYLACKTENKIDNKIGDAGCYRILNNAKYLTNIEILNLESTKE